MQVCFTRGCIKLSDNNGLRLKVYVTGGEVSGPKIQGKLLPVCVDWVTLRLDGIGVFYVRETIKNQR
jgi:hypothetical protein